MVRTLQQARKDSGFEVTDRVMLLWQSDDDRVIIRETWRDDRREILAEEIVRTAAPAAMKMHDPQMRVALRRAQL